MHFHATLVVRLAGVWVNLSMTLSFLDPRYTWPKPMMNAVPNCTGGSWVCARSCLLSRFSTSVSRSRVHLIHARHEKVCGPGRCVFDKGLAGHFCRVDSLAGIGCIQDGAGSSLGLVYHGLLDETTLCWRLFWSLSLWMGTSGVLHANDSGLFLEPCKVSWNLTVVWT